MKRFKLIVPSFIAIIFCMLLIAGSTFALFTSEATASVAVTSGKVKIEASLGQPTLYSADATLTEGDLAGTILATDEENGKYAGTYYFKEQTGTFANGGTASKEGNTLTLDRMTPGDKVKAGLAITNSSNVKIKYRLTLEAHATGKNNETNKENAELLKVLKVKFFDKTYTGLQKFVSAWMYRDAVTTSEQLDTGLEIELPLEAGNDYQGLTVSYTILVEAVQANAKTTDAGVTEYVNNTTTQTGTDSKKVEANPTEPVVLETTTAPQEEKTTKAEFSGAFEVAEQGSDVKLDVETASFETASQTSYTVVAEEATPVASVDLNLTVDGKTVSNFKEGGSSKITTYIVKGLNTVSIVYNGDNTKAFGAGQTTSRKDSEAAVTAVGDYFYDSATGKLVFVTDHFSEYVPVTNDDLEAVNLSTNLVYAKFNDCLAAAESGASISILKDITFNAVTMISKSLTINGNGHKFNYNATRGIRVDTDDVVLSLNDLSVIGKTSCERGIQVDTNVSGVSIDMNNVTVSGVTHYAINLCLGSTINININDSYISGWAAINAYGNGININVNNSTLEGLNPYSGSSNAFCTICLEGDTTNMTTIHSKDYVIVISNSTIKASRTGDQSQSILGFNRHSTNSSVTFNNCEFEIGEGCKFLYNNGTNNKLYIDNTEVAIGYESLSFNTENLIISNDGSSATGSIQITLGNDTKTFNLSDAEVSEWDDGEDTGTDYVFANALLNGRNYYLDFDISGAYSEEGGWHLYFGPIFNY